MSWRIDGVLQPLGRVPKDWPQRRHADEGARPAAHLPDQRAAGGRIAAGDPGAVEVRISTFPTLFGEKIVARNPPRGEQPLARIADLGLPADVSQALRDALRQDLRR